MQLIWILEDLDHARDWLLAAAAQAFPQARVQAYARLRDALDALVGERPDLALVDLKLPDGSGLELIARLREAPSACCVVTTVFDDDAHLFPALRAGAEGYVLKDQSRAQLVDLLLGITAGRPPLSPSIARRLLRHFQPEPETLAARLTPRETEVLRLIAKGLVAAEVADVLGISRHTCAGYVKDIYRKLEVSSRAEATLEAARRGLV